MSIDTTKASYLSSSTIDKVIFSASFSVAASGTYTIGADTVKIGAQLALPLGIISTDGGTTWSDFAFSCFPDGSIQYSVSGPSLVRMCLLALATPTVPIPGTTSLSGALALSSVSKTGGGTLYRQIVGTGEGVNAGAAPGEMTIPHGLPYIPDIAYWAITGVDIDHSTQISGFSSNDNLSGTLGICVDATNIYLMKYFSGTRYYYREYHP